MDEVLKRLVVRIGYDVDAQSRERVDSDQQRTEAKSVAIGQLAAASIQKAAAIAVDVIRALTGAVVDAVEQFAELGGEIADTATKTGTGTDELQRLRYATKLSGVDVGQLTGGLRELGKGLTEARTKGTGPFAEGLGLIGVSLRELEGLSAEDQIKLLSDAIRGVPDDAERGAAALKLFGGSGQELLPLLMQGSAGISELTARAESLGLVLDRETIAKSEALGDTLDNLDMQAKITAARVGSYLAPIVTDAAERMGAWAAENRGFIETDLPAAITAIVSAGGTMLAWLADVVSETRNFVREIGFAYDRSAEWATELRESLAPAIEVVSGIVETWADAFVGLNSAIGEGIAKVLDYVGVLDTLRAAWDALPFTGESIDELTQRLHGGGASDYFRRASGGGGPVQGGRDENGNPISVSGRATGGGQAGAARAARDTVDAIVSSALAAAAKATADANAAANSSPDARASARAAYRESLARKGAGGGGGGKASGPSGSETLSKMWGALTGETEPSWLDRTAAAFGLGDGGPREFGGGGGGGGGGSSPLAGATFSRIDASFNAQTTIQIEIPAEVAALGSAAVAADIADRVAAAIDARNEDAFAHYQQTLRTA